MGEVSGNGEVAVVVSPDSGNDREKKELLMRIGTMCLELTANPQTDIEPGDLMNMTNDGVVSGRDYSNQLKNPRLLNGKKITRAVEMVNRDGSKTTMIVAGDKDENLVCVRVNEGMAARAKGLFDANVSVSPDYKEVVVGILRRNTNQRRILGIGEKQQSFEDQIVIGGVPGEGVDNQISRIVTVQDSEVGNWNIRREIFGMHALSDIPTIPIRSSERFVETSVSDLQQIVQIINQCKILPDLMTKGLVEKHDQFKARNQ